MRERERERQRDEERERRVGRKSDVMWMKEVLVQIKGVFLAGSSSLFWSRRIADGFFHRGVCLCFMADTPLTELSAQLCTRGSRGDGVELGFFFFHLLKSEL